MLPPSPCLTIGDYLCRFLAYACSSRQIHLRYCSSKPNMGPGKNAVPSASGSSPRPSVSVVSNEQSPDAYSVGKRRFSHERSRVSQKKNQVFTKKKPMSHHRQTTTFGEKGLSQRVEVEQAMHSSANRGIQSVQSESSYVQNCDHEEEYPPLSVNKGCSSKGMNSGGRKTRIDLESEQRKEDIRSPDLVGSNIADSTSPCEGFSLPTEFGKKAMNLGIRKAGVDLGTEQWKEAELLGLNIANISSTCEDFSLPMQFGKKATYGEKSHSGCCQSRNSASDENSMCYKDSVKVERFYICNCRSRKFDGRNVSIIESKWQNRIKIDPALEGIERRVLRSGMVLLKHFIAIPDQIRIVRTCHNLGQGPGGFYQPGYNDGAKLRLHMMCLGLNWDPQTRKYSKEHPVDCCEPPGIPHYFSLLVHRAIQEAHTLIKKDLRGGNVEDTLPTMSPDICIVNFYTSNGRLGLHQDRDESRESIHKGLPVVSFSIGDSAEFLYGNERSIDRAENVLLESGDVLIFGGESRLVFHGVTSVVPDSAPEALLAETRMRPGRLNLTFRKF